MPSTQHLGVELRMEAVLERTAANKCVYIQGMHVRIVLKYSFMNQHIHGAYINCINMTLRMGTAGSSGT